MIDAVRSQPTTDPLLGLLNSFLPVRSLKEFLPQLADGLRTLCDGAAMLCVCRMAKDQSLAVGWCAHDGEPVFWTASGDLPGEESVIDWLTEHATGRGLNIEDLRRQATSHQMLELANATVVFCSFGSDQGMTSAVAEPLFAELLNGLIQQTLIIERAEARLAEDEASRLREKLESMAEFAAGAGHEINNPLATITGRVQQLLRDENDPDRRRALSTIGGQALRVRDMIGDAMLFARPPEPELQAVELVSAVRCVVEKLQSDIALRGCEVHIDGDDAIRVLADPTQLNVVISNLVRNSLEAIDDETGRIDLQCQPSENGFAEFTVTDNGRGFTENDRRHLFDPFYSGRQAGRGLGFGLCKCWRIVSNHGGRIEAASETGRTTFRVHWPIAETA